MPSSQKLQILLKPKCTWMFIGWSSTKFTFFVPIWNSKWRLFNIEPYRKNVSKRFFSETTWTIETKLCWNNSWMAPFQNCVRWSRLPTKMAAKLKIEKRGDEILIFHCCFSVSQNELKCNCCYMARSSLTLFRIFLRNFSFSRYIPIMQIRHILIKDCI